MTHRPLEITFSNGNHAKFSCQDGHDPQGLLDQVDLPSGKGRPVVVVCGGAGELNGNGQARAVQRREHQDRNRSLRSSCPCQRHPSNRRSE